MDIVPPIAGYYLLSKVFGLATVPALALASIFPMLRTVIGFVKDHRVNALAAVMLALNVAGIGLSFVTGDPRLMIAKDSGLSSVIGIGLLVSALRNRPLMSEPLQPFIVKGDAARAAAWQRLAGTSDRFGHYLRRYTMIWAFVLLAECALRIVGAFALPVGTMMWLSTVLIVSAIVIAVVISGASTVPLEQLVVAETARIDGPAPD